MLVLAAFLTAFYTMRQIALVFLGKPRTPLAAHAHESNRFMTVPLVVLAFFALTAGWVGIPDNFLGTEGVFTNHYHHFVGASLYDTLSELSGAGLVTHKISTLEFSAVPLLASLVISLGGLAVGYWIFGREPLRQEQPDPLI